MQNAQVVIIFGSTRDHERMMQDGTIGQWVALLTQVGISWTMSAISAHRNPGALEKYCLERVAVGADGPKVLLAVAGKAAALAGAIKAAIRGLRPVPVFALALPSEPFGVQDAIYATLSLPAGTPVGTLTDRLNALLAACEVVAVANSDVSFKLMQYYTDANTQPKLDFAGSKGANHDPTGV